MASPTALKSPIPPSGSPDGENPRVDGEIGDGTATRAPASAAPASAAPASAAPASAAPASAAPASATPASAADRAEAALAAKAKAKAQRAALRRAATPPRRRYGLGQLREVALQRGRQIVEKSGVNALTLRGLARELGVSAPALLYYFRTRDGLRAAVAERVQEDLAKMTVPPVAAKLRVDLEATGKAWIAFAEKNANLYRLAFGEGWRSPGQGWRSAWMALPLPTNRLEHTVRRGLTIANHAAPLPPEQLAPLAHQVAVGIHGLAMARADGASPRVVRDALALLLTSVPAGSQAPATGAAG